ncbi:MAG: RNA polymerase-associated protein RapA [Syntrophorhabdaceae bacterium]|nr:RNA polymerase-associated protein RapA [Syntrophorhabdaceae bacterium]
MVATNNHSIPSSIRDNRTRGSVGDFLSANLHPDSEVAIVSAYFTIFAYQRLKEKLDSIKSLDFLFGEPRFLQALDPNKTDKKEFQIEDDKLVIPLASRLQQRNVARECAAWIREKVSIKLMVKPNFLHGKMYYLRDRNGIEKTVAGSSNFTVNGLGFGKSPNIELNIEIDSDRDRADLYAWFQEIWNDDSGLVEDVKEEVLKYLEQLYVENDPEFIYYKTLYHIFEKYFSNQKDNTKLDESTGFLDTQIWHMLYDFQKDGVRGAINKILNHNGCIIADSVGLGKTFEALAVIKYFELKNLRSILVLCPKKLRENWTIYTRNDELNPFADERFRYDVLSHTDLSRRNGRSGDIDLTTNNWDNYDLIVIDESHNFRNSGRGHANEDGTFTKSRYARLMEDIIKKGVKTKVLLLSATPVNNNLRDLRNQIYLITAGSDEALRDSAQINNIGQTLKNAQTQFTNWADPKKNPERRVEDLQEKLDSAFFKLLDELTLARSRKHIMRHYDLAKLGAFPRRLPVISLAPDIDTRAEFPSYDQLNQEIANYRLSLFNPFAYVKLEQRGKYEALAGGSIQAFTQTRREHYLTGMMKVNFLKRLESSIESFEISMRRTLEKIKELETKIQEFRFDEAFGFNAFTPDEADLDGDDDLAQMGEDTEVVGKKFQYKLADMNVDEWLEDLQEDKNALTKLHNAARAVTPERDQKLCKLKEMIAQKMRQPLNDSNRKALIFTAFADTAVYLYECLEEWARNHLGVHIAMVTGGSRENRSTLQPKSLQSQTDFNAILTNFSPRSKQRAKMKGMPHAEEIDVLIATDCISEGQNLQDCDYLINYDIHWNPVRIIQRFGRIDRLGSRNEKIQLINFWPTADLNKYINLKDRVEARMALVDLTATGEDNLLDPKQIEDLVAGDLKYRDKQLLRLKDEVLDLEDMGENVTLTEFTLGEFRLDLDRFIKNNEQRLKDAPFGLYALAPASDEARIARNEVEMISPHCNDKPDVTHSTSLIQPGVIFCLRQKGETAGNEQVNPLQPYFLVYVYDGGQVRCNYTHAKQILEILRSRCLGKNKPYQKLCDLFDAETDHGCNMQVYNQLLQNAVKEIARLFRHRSARALRTDREALLIPQQNQVATMDGFELITWLIIK